MIRGRTGSPKALRAVERGLRRMVTHEQPSLYGNGWLLRKAYRVRHDRRLNRGGALAPHYWPAFPLATVKTGRILNMRIDAAPGTSSLGEHYEKRSRAARGL